jgi:phosphoribosylamine-glycine ligase
MVLGVGSFAYSAAQILKEAGAEVCTYLTRDYAQHPPSLAGATFRREDHPSPAPLVRARRIGLLLPHSIDWAQAPWCDDLLATGVPILCPTGEALRIERERDFARHLCRRFGIPFPESHLAASRSEAEAILARQPKAYVIKNPLCSPTSPIHTIVCETAGDTRAWLPRLDYAEGVFLQEYLGRAEAGHIALVSDGEIYSLVTNQEFKRAFAGNMGIVAGAPLGGLVERDPEDKYGLARQLLHPLRPWLRESGFKGPLQVTAVQRDGQWQVIEYNVRLGVTSGAMILRMLADPVNVLVRIARGEPTPIAFRPGRAFGCSVTLAGYGYPYIQVLGPPLPIQIAGDFAGDVWWNEVAAETGESLVATGHRIADVVGFGETLAEARARAYADLRKIRCLGSYYREDIGLSLWPPGSP